MYKDVGGKVLHYVQRLCVREVATQCVQRLCVASCRMWCVGRLLIARAVRLWFRFDKETLYVCLGVGMLTFVCRNNSDAQ